MRKTNRTYKERKEYLAKRRREFMARAVEYKGGVCAKCGKPWIKDYFDFHHIDRKTKSFGISSNLTRKWEDIKTELDKCTLLCLDCHRETFSS